MIHAIRDGTIFVIIILVLFLLMLMVLLLLLLLLFLFPALVQGANAETFDITTFGAKANDESDDTTAIEMSG